LTPTNQEVPVQANQVAWPFITIQWHAPDLSKRK